MTDAGAQAAAVDAAATVAAFRDTSVRPQLTLEEAADSQFRLVDRIRR